MPEKNSTAQSDERLIGKRDPGFAPLRRGYLPHMAEKSSNAVKLYLWFQLTAFWKGPKRGWVEASFDDMARGNGWSLKTLQRTIEELEEYPYIEVERATNQYELTRVRILKYDPEESTSAMDKFDQSIVAQAGGAVSAPVSGAVKSDHSKPGSLQNQQDLQAPKKLRSKEEKKERLDAVRRPIDAEQRHSPKGVFSPSEKRKKLTGRLAAAIEKTGDSFAVWIKECQRRGWDHPFGDDEQQAFEALQYDPNLNSPLLSIGFVGAAVYVWEENREKGLPPGILCSKVIDYCERERKSFRTLRDKDEGYYYPPDFVIHRNHLRAKERVIEQGTRTPAEVLA